MGNSWAALVVVMLGLAANVPWRSVLGWWLAWPLCQALLPLDAGATAVVGGLSGPLHAGAVLVAWHVARHHPPASRWVGWALLAGVALKLGTEALAGPQPLSAHDDQAQQVSQWVSQASHRVAVGTALLLAWALDGIMGVSPFRRPP